MGEYIITLLSVWAGLIGFLMFPAYVAVHAGRKGYRAVSIVIYVMYASVILAPFTPIVALPAFFACTIYRPNLDAEPRLLLYGPAGTSFCGAMRRAEDGSFLTTQWFRLFLVPLAPLQSYRVTYEGTSSSKSLATTTRTKHYLIVEKLPLHLGQVAITLLPLIAFSFLFPVPIIWKGDAAFAAMFAGIAVLAAGGLFLWRAK